jgi:glycerol kinase
MSARGPLVLAIDQGTSATKCVLVDAEGRIVARASSPLGESRPQPGWVEQDAEEIWLSVQTAVRDCLKGHDPRAVIAVGLSNQRESLVLWDRRSGTPLAPVVSWQDQRTTADCDALRTDAVEAMVRERSGLPLDPMFSAAKARWLLDRHDPGRAMARAGKVCLGTIDSWLVSRFSGAHRIELGNAARTQLLNVRQAAWDDDLLGLFGVPRAALPELTASCGPWPATSGLAPLPDGVPLHAVMGDSHAALFAHGARGPGQVKATYGTGSSVMGLIAGPQTLGAGLCLTIAWQTAEVVHAAEGNIRSAGSALRWMAELLGMSPAELGALGATAASDGVVLVPAFTGLGAPWWDDHASGLVANLTLGTGRVQLARAALESIAHQVADVVEALGAIEALHVDGGPTRNDSLVQLQADLLGCPVHRAEDTELSALGVAHMAGIGAGLWSPEECLALPRAQRAFAPAMPGTQRRAARRSWRVAIARARLRPAT